MKRTSPILIISVNTLILFLIALYLRLK